MASILLALLLTGCTLLHRNDIVEGIFPDVGAYQDGLDVPEKWAQ